MTWQIIIQLSKLLLLFLIITPVTTYRILGLFPHNGVSHFHFFHPIMTQLAKAGHDVTVVSHFPEKHPPKNYKDLPLTGMTSLSDTIDLSAFTERSSYAHFTEFFLLKSWGEASCQNALNSSAIATVLKSKKPYDVILIEQFNTDCMMGIAWKLQAPVIGVCSSPLMPWHYDRVGNPQIPSYISAIFLGYSDKMSFKQRLSNWLSIHTMKLMYKAFVDSSANKMLRTYIGNDIPSVTELSKKINIMFLNQHYSLSGPKPLSPSVIELGGIHIQEPKPMEEKLQKLLDSAEHGVIYISWGSMIRADSLPVEKREGLLKALGKLKQIVLWKWENNTLPNKPTNVYIQKWLPQREILCHPKVRVFLAHGGLLGSSEAAYCGVPVVSTPMYGDQFQNSAALVNRGMGKIVHFEDISEETIAAAIDFALDPATQDNAKKISYSYRNRPQKPLETAVWWVEHVAATGGAPFTKSQSTFLHGLVYHSLDVYTFLIIGFSVCVASWIWVVRTYIALRSPKTKSD